MSDFAFLFAIVVLVIINFALRRQLKHKDQLIDRYQKACDDLKATCDMQADTNERLLALCSGKEGGA